MTNKKLKSIVENVILDYILDYGVVSDNLGEIDLKEIDIGTLKTYYSQQQGNA